MAGNEKYGFIVFLDALGARTTDLQVCKDYLTRIEELKKILRISLVAFDVVDPPASKEIIETISSGLKYRFFGDSILMSYEIPRGQSPEKVLFFISFIVNNFICAALEVKLLFRGALSIGDYVESQDHLLGPAITDAANWYERADMIGVIVTPATANYLKSFYGISLQSTERQIEMPIFDLLLYDVPITAEKRIQGEKIMTYVLNWPYVINVAYSLKKNIDPLTWYYKQIESLLVPLGTETKFSNTETFVGISLKKIALVQQTIINAESAKS